MQLLLLSAAASRKDSYDFYSYLSGQDYPVKPIDFILEDLAKDKEMEFIEYFSLPAPDQWDGDGGLHRFYYFWPVDEMGFDKCLKFYQHLNLVFLLQFLFCPIFL